jgi:DNA-binding FadR family transcriptional regulator
MSPAAKALRTPSLSSVFQTLLSDIVSGRYPAGSHLPAERQLSLRLGASRPTLREALRRLGEWGLVEPKRGSGIVVRPWDDWSIDVLPAYLRYAAAARGPHELLRAVTDLLAIRRLLFLDVIRLVAPHVHPAALAEAHAAALRAWAARADHAAFVREDFLLVRAIARAGRFLPALWLLNKLSDVYFDLAGSIALPASVPEGYLASWTRILDALATRDSDLAARHLGEYLDEHDRNLLTALTGAAP